jgi:hypothetical protein
MSPHVFLFLFLFILAGCTTSPRLIYPAPTAIRFPPTWTPAPTETPKPPPPTETLVIQSTPGDLNATPGIFRRYPSSSYNTIGAWVDTTHISKDALAQLASHIQLATGPQAGVVQRLNSRVITLQRLDSTGDLEDASSLTGALDSASDGVLLEHVGIGSSTDQFANSDKLLGSVRNSLDTRLLIADAYAWSDGASFAVHSSDAVSLLGRVDGLCICGFLRASNAPVPAFKTEMEWKADVDALAALSSYPNLVVLVATRFDQVSDSEVDLLQSWFDYALASFLMGENGSDTFFSFQGPRADDYMAGGALSATLGNPVGGYYPNYGMYARHFQRGLVVVNAGDSAREMPLTRLYTTPLGEKLTSVRLEPHTGEILLVQP